jgi:uncharacterized protein
MARWDRIVSRGNVEDRRSMAPAAIGGLGVGGVALLILFNVLTGGDISDVLGQLTEVATQNQQSLTREEFLGEDDYEVFTSTVLGSNNEMWQQVFTQNSLTYEPPRLVLFRTATQSLCGTATSQVGPHYCSLDETIYLDETFFDELTNRFGAIGGDVAEAYVISHEVGHHVQNQLGTLQQVQSDNSNQSSVQLELQADCFAGVWANSLRDDEVFLPGEIEEAIDAAAAVGDDRIQERVTGYVNPETWTHGSSSQRKDWFNRGFESGSAASCDTFTR